MYKIDQGFLLIFILLTFFWSSSLLVLYQAKHFYMYGYMLMCPGINHFISLLFLIWTQNDWTMFLFIRHLTDSLRENKRKKKIKIWPIYREHEGMWSRSNLSLPMCGCVWCPCVWCLNDECWFSFLLHFIQLYLSRFVSSWVLNSPRITRDHFLKPCMTTSTTSYRVWEWNNSLSQSNTVDLQCSALYSPNIQKVKQQEK